ITAVHLPSGTQYIGATRAHGRFVIPGMRVGGPYQVSATMIGFARQSRDDIQVALGAAADPVFSMSAVATQLSAVTVTSEGGQLSSTRTGAATQVRREALEQLPTISRRLSDFTRLTPQSSGTSFAGQDNRLNNITIDGAAFNNSFGLGGQPGDRTGVSPISLDAVEAVQVNIAPFDVRQGGFVGAAINTVTRSGNNDFQGSLYYNVRDQDYVGRNAGRRTFNPGTFSFDQIGFRLGGPILKDKLFFFVSYESDENSAPGNTNLPREASQSAGGNITRVLRSDLIAVRDTLQALFGYNPGEFEGYPGATPSSRLTARFDYALSDRNKFSFRYTSLDSETDNLVSTSSSLGFGRNRGLSMSYTGSNYTILENIDSYAAEWNSLITDRMSNQLLFTYTKQDESRGAISNLFPFVDILAGDIPGQSGTYISFGSEPFTPNNELRYSNWQLQNNFTIYGNRHDLTFGLNIEGYESENVFFPGKQSAYVYNRLSDFYADARAFVNACGTAPAAQLTCSAYGASAAGDGPRRFQVRFANVPGMVKPVQPLEVNFMGAYVQDEWRAGRGLTVTGGLRIDVVSFGNTAQENTAVNAMTFRGENGNPVQYSTAKLPDATPLLSPRLGFNYDVRGNGQTIVRGGTGIFTGRPAYVWISNQIGNNGIMTGFIQDDAPGGGELTTRPFHPNPDNYKPATVTGAPPASYELALTDKSFKFPQVWRSNLAVDHRFESGWLVTTEFLWGKDVNGVYYINANLPTADASFSGLDNRSRWVSDKCAGVSGTQTNRINCSVTSAVVLKNQNVGETYNASISLERAFRNGFYTKGAFAYGTATNTVDAGSIAFGSWNNNQHTGDPNNPGIGNGAGYQGRRAFLVSSYTRDWFGWGNTTISAFLENFSVGQSSYVFDGDLNGDGGTSNDLLYIHANINDMNFAPTGSFTAAQQAEAWNAYINQDPHLRTRRGQYAMRGGLILPQVTRMDLSISQDLSRMFAGKKNSLQVRLDILNFTNMINSDWGLSQSVINARPLIPVAPETTGPRANQPRYTMATQNGQLLTSTFQKNAGTNDVWRMQLGLRYTFN
ncbi:MAG TPA: hypothetical protein PK788_03465, partial [Gemmatimonadaceae bacterium]|nr:hypothetical protein [Gemmatimonadaceae bacterium]